MVGGSDVTTGAIPNQTYSMHRKIEDYVLAQIGITTGHQGFDNNVLLIEALMKILPQALFAQSIGAFDNPINKEKSKVIIPQLWLNRLDQIWRKGLHCLVYRDPVNTHVIKNRIVLYKHEKPDMPIKGKTYMNPWEVMHPCLGCGKLTMIGFLRHNDFNVDETVCELVCQECDFRDIVEVEIKPALKTMIPLRPRSTNPIWVQVSANCPVRYALEGVDLMALSSTEGGYFYEVGAQQIPIFQSFEEIDESPDTTTFPSQKYYDDTTDLEYDEWLFHYHKILILLHKMVTEKYSLPSMLSTPTAKRESMERA